MAHWFGQTSSVSQGLLGNAFSQAKEREEKRWIGSGLCIECYRAKVDRETKEEQLIRQAQLAQAKETLETPSVWVCKHCNTVNRGRFCSNCGVSRKADS
jgi:membrane protease subunit (stomatin/prohibitin family)